MRGAAKPSLAERGVRRNRHEAHARLATCAGRYPGLRPHRVRLPADPAAQWPWTKCAAFVESRRSRTVAGTAQVGTVVLPVSRLTAHARTSACASTRRAPTISQDRRPKLPGKARRSLTLVRARP